MRINEEDEKDMKKEQTDSKEIVPYRIYEKNMKKRKKKQKDEEEEEDKEEEGEDEDNGKPKGCKYKYVKNKCKKSIAMF